jgi:hypothetical protein
MSGLRAARVSQTCLDSAVTTAMFLGPRPSLRLLPVFSKVHVAIRSRSRITLPVAAHRNTQTRLLTLPAPHVAQRFDVGVYASTTF